MCSSDLTSPGNVRGYLGASEDPGPFEGASFFPGDHGFLSREGILSIFGRENNIVNIGGIKTTHELIEARYLDAPAVREAAAGIVLDALGIERIVAHIVPADNWSEEAFRAYCQRALAREYWPIRIVLTQRLPRLPTGKIDRRQVTSLSLPS